jgi:hypothetical protein
MVQFVVILFPIFVSVLCPGFSKICFPSSFDGRVVVADNRRFKAPGCTLLLKPDEPTIRTTKHSLPRFQKGNNIFGHVVVSVV